MSFVNQPGRDIDVKLDQMECIVCEGGFSENWLAFRISRLYGDEMISDDEPAYVCTGACLDAVISQLIDVELVRLHDYDEVEEERELSEMPLV